MNIRPLLHAALIAAVGSFALFQCRVSAQETTPSTSVPQTKALEGQTIHVNPASGTDTNTGEQGNPLRTLAEAARRVNQAEGSGPITVLLSEGVYAVGETVVFKPEHWKFSKSARLTIRAEILPDDGDWHPGRMPTFIHTLPLGLPGAPHLEFGLIAETSHVTIQGIKFLGAPVVETPKPGKLVRVYPIGRMDRTLDDLEIAQCVFAGDRVTNPHHLGVLANGSGINVHHCIFYGVKLTMVYWTAGSGGHAMTNCFIHGAYGSGIWTTEIADDFLFRNNVIANSNYVWTYQSGRMARRDPDGSEKQEASTAAANEGPVHYQVLDSLISGNQKLASSGTGANLGFKDIDSSFLELVRTTVSDQSVVVDLNETSRHYLHPLPDSDAAKIGAGLFLKRED